MKPLSKYEEAIILYCKGNMTKLSKTSNKFIDGLKYLMCQFYLVEDMSEYHLVDNLLRFSKELVSAVNYNIIIDEMVRTITKTRTIDFVGKSDSCSDSAYMIGVIVGKLGITMVEFNGNVDETIKQINGELQQFYKTGKVFQ